MHGGATAALPLDTDRPNQAKLYQDGNNFLRKWVGLITHSSAWTGHSAVSSPGTWPASDPAPFGPTDLRPGPDSPHAARDACDPTTGAGGDLAGGTVYGGGRVPMIVVASGSGTASTGALRPRLAAADHRRGFGLPLLGNAGDSVQVTSLYPLL